MARSSYPQRRLSCRPGPGSLDRSLDFPTKTEDGTLQKPTSSIGVGQHLKDLSSHFHRFASPTHINLFCEQV